MNERQLLSDFETYVDGTYGVKIAHAYNYRQIRRFFSNLSFRASVDRNPIGSPASLHDWPPLDVFRSGYFQREILAAIRTRGFQRANLANMLVPVGIVSEHQRVSQKILDAVVRSFFLHRYTARSRPLSEMHQEFATWLLLSFVSDRVMVIETDFSHERNMALKYTVRPFEGKTLRTPPVAPRANLFLSRSIASAVKSGTYIGVHPTISDAFSREIGYSDFNGMDDQVMFGPETGSGFLVIAGSRQAYQCAYIAPLYSLINRQSLVMSRIQKLFSTFMDILGNEARYIIDVNKHHSRLRHTIGVEVYHLKKFYEEIISLRPRILENFDGDRNNLNIQFAKVNGLLHDISNDVSKQFGSEFDLFGNRRARRGEQSGRASLSPERLSAMLREMIRNIGEKRNHTHFLLEFGHKSPVEVASENTLAICFTELLNNAVKYNVAADRIRIRTRDGNDSVIMTINNTGPSLTEHESELMPLMGLRGLNSQRLVDEGSGQGLATVFSILEDIGVDAEYKQRPLTREQINKLASEHGSRRIADLDLSSHTVELAFPKA